MRPLHLVLLLLVISLGAVTARKPWDPKGPPQNEWVEVRKAKKATKEEVARANAEENLRLAAKNAKTEVKSAKSAVKKSAARIRELEKYSKRAYAENQKLVRQLQAKEKDIARMHEAIKKWAFKRSGLITFAVTCAIVTFCIGLIVGLTIGLLIRKAKARAETA